MMCNLLSPYNPLSSLHKHSKMLVPTIPEMKRILPLIHSCFTSKETRSEKSDQAKLTQWVGTGIRIQVSRLPSQGQLHEATAATHQFRHTVLLLCSQSCNLRTSAKEQFPSSLSAFALGTKLIVQPSAIAQPRHRPKSFSHTTHSTIKPARIYTKSLKINVAITTTLFYFL